MPFPKVRISVTFIDTKYDIKPNLMIQNPINLTDGIGDFELCHFSAVRDALEELS
jgi:hypothetical protein